MARRGRWMRRRRSLADRVSHSLVHTRAQSRTRPARTPPNTFSSPFAASPDRPRATRPTGPRAVGIVAARPPRKAREGLLFIVVVPALKGPLPAVVTPDLAPTWQRITEELQRAVPESTFEIWLAPLRAVSLDAAHLTVSAPPELRAWVSERFGRLLQACAAVHLGLGATVDVVDVGARTAARVHGPRGGEQDGEPRFSDGGSHSLNPKYTFDSYVIGDSNRFAHAAALAVAEMPGGAYNPLFIYGPPGVGKTHLLHSIGNYVQ